MDQALLLQINQAWAHPWLDVLMPWLSAKLGFSFPLLALIVAYLGWRHGAAGWRTAVALLLLVALGDSLGNLLKYLLDQPRPCLDMAPLLRRPDGAPFAPCAHSSTGMPSNHALNFFATFAYLSVVFRSNWLRLGMLAIAVGVAWSRVYLGQHYPSQVLVGAVLGLVLGWGYAGFCRWRWNFIDQVRRAEARR